MRCYIRALLLCMVFAVFSGLYVYNKLLYSDLPGHRIKSGFGTSRSPGDSREILDKIRPGTQHWYNRCGVFLNIICCNKVLLL